MYATYANIRAKLNRIPTNTFGSFRLPPSPSAAAPGSPGRTWHVTNVCILGSFVNPNAPTCCTDGYTISGDIAEPHAPKYRFTTQRPCPHAALHY